MWTPDEVVPIDRAAHAADRETDLAMLVVFGCRQYDVTLAGSSAALQHFVIPPPSRLACTKNLSMAI